MGWDAGLGGACGGARPAAGGPSYGSNRERAGRGLAIGGGAGEDRQPEVVTDQRAREAFGLPPLADANGAVREDENEEVQPHRASVDEHEEPPERDHAEGVERLEAQPLLRQLDVA